MKHLAAIAQMEATAWHASSDDYYCPIDESVARENGGKNP